MTEECKKQLKSAGIEVDEAIARFLGNEELYLKFLMKFPGDKSFINLEHALEENNLDGAFKSAHTLKGVAGNLSINYLYDLLVPFVEILREKDLETAKIKQIELKTAYTVIIEGILKVNQRFFE